MLNKGLRYRDAAMINISSVVAGYKGYSHDGYDHQMDLCEDCSFSKIVIYR